MGYGVLAGVVHLLGSVLDGLSRPGLDFAHGSRSLLSLGDRGWVHVVVLVLTGWLALASVRAYREAHEAGRIPARSDLASA